MIIQNSLKLLNELSTIESKITEYEAILNKIAPNIESHKILEQIIMSKIIEKK